MITNLTAFADTATGWQRTLYAFLAEKEQHSGSRRTVESYSRMLQDFFGRSGKQPDQVSAQDIFVYAHGPGLSGKQPSAITIGARIACLSAFYRFLIRMDIVQSNPCDKLQRPKVSPSPPRGLSGDQAHDLLAIIPDSPVGLRDRAIILAKLRRDAGETVEEVSRFLDHSSLTVTTVYLRRLEGEQDRSWAKVAQAIGIVN